jgi:GntR family transcriptional repressor for pyruvate dehydrogenase complex
MIEILKPIDTTGRETVTAEIGRKVLAFLLSGSLQPGDRLPSERQLAERLGVGRSVVRDALKSITLLGLLDVRQGDGTFLRQTRSELLPKAIEWGLMLGEKRTLDLVEARRYLEPILAGLAAERRDEATLEELRNHLRAMADANGNAKRFVAADVAFHLTLGRASRNSAMSDMLANIRSLLQVWITRVMEAATDFGPSYREHLPVLAAVERGDVLSARGAMEEHLNHASERLIQTLSPDDTLTK